MKISCKHEQLRQILISHAAEVDFKDFLSLYKKHLLTSVTFLVNDTSFACFDSLYFQKNLIDKSFFITNVKVVLAVDESIRNEKVQ